MLGTGNHPHYVRMHLLPVLLVLLSFGHNVLGQTAPERVGMPWTGEPGVRETTHSIMAREAAQTRHSQRPKVNQRSRGDFQNLPLNPDSPRVDTWPGPGEAVTADASTNAVQNPVLGFTAATLADTGSYPPDSMGAAGPAQYILAVNGRIRSFNKRTGQADGILNADMDVFFRPVMTPPATNNFTSDPRIRYDRLSRRWFVTIIDVPGKSGALPNRILLAVSDSPIISAVTVWTFFYFQHDLVTPAGDTGKFADYPTLGVDANALYMGVNIFGTRGTGAFSDTTAFVIRKSSVLGSGPIVVTAFRNLVRKVQGVTTGPYTPQGVDNFDPSATEGYFIGVDAGLYGRLALRRVTNPGGTPTMSDNIMVSIPVNGNTITVPHLGNTGGTAGYIDGLDYRLIMAHVRGGHLWTCANIAVDNTGSPAGADSRMGMRWYELAGVASGQTPSVSQSGTIYQPSAANTTDQRNYWMGAINVSGQRHALMGFSVAGANEFINAGFTGRLAEDPPGTMRDPVLYTATSSAYNPPRDPGGPEGRRWGDYSYTCIDPDDDMTFWTVQQFCDAPNSYGLRVAKVLAPPPATPASCGPESLPAGSTSVNVLVTGVSTNGSGFFDPGSGFSNRLAAAFSGTGITVNSVVYGNPSNVTLNISISAAAATGARSLSITNPDGQAIDSATGIFTVIGGNTPPTISAINNLSINEDTSTGSLPFTVGDVETSATALTVTRGSSNTNLLPLSGILLGGSGSNRTVQLFPATNQHGTTTVTLTVTDPAGARASNSFVLTVLPVNDPPLLGTIADRIIHAGTHLSFTVAASDPDLPADSLNYNLIGGPPSGAQIDATTGQFTWTNTLQSGTHQFTVRVTDSGTPPGSDTATFNVEVRAPPAFQSITLSSNAVHLAWSAIVGTAYRLQFTSDLGNPVWQTVPGDIAATIDPAEIFVPLGTNAQTFYRLLVVEP
jgi:hypothetical protein